MQAPEEPAELLSARQRLDAGHIAVEEAAGEGMGGRDFQLRSN